MSLRHSLVLAAKLACSMAIILLIGSKSIAAISNPHIAFDAGGWDPGSTPLTETGPGTGIYSIVLHGLNAGSRHEFKITDGTWSNALPDSNSWFYADAMGNCTINFDSNVHSDGWLPVSDRIGESVDPGAWTLAGNFEGWSNNNPAGAMTALGGGIYQYSHVLTPGSYECIPVVTGTWDSLGSDNRSTNSSHLSFTTTAAMPLATVSIDAIKGTVRVEVSAVPEPATLGLLATAMVGIGAALFARRQGIKRR